MYTVSIQEQFVLIGAGYDGASTVIVHAYYHQLLASLNASRYQATRPNIFFLANWMSEKQACCILTKESLKFTTKS